MEDRAPAPTTSESLIDQLLGIPAGPGREAFIRQHLQQLDLATAQQLKSKVDHLMRADQAKAGEVADLILQIANVNRDLEQQALGLIAAANVKLIARGEFALSIELYDQAAAIYRSLDLPVEHARSQIGRVAALAGLGEYTEAIRSGELALDALEKHNRFDLIVGLASNLGLAHGHSGDDARSLVMFDRAAEVHASQNQELDSTSSLLEMNRSFALRALGRYDEAIQTGRRAIEGFSQASEPAEVARAKLHLALTYYLLGHYGQALTLLFESREAFVADNRLHDTALVDLFRTDCLLELRRSAEVVELCSAIRHDFAARGAIDLIAQLIVNEAVAFTQLEEHGRALDSLDEARAIFEASDNQLWLGATRLKTAAVLRLLGRSQACLKLAAELAQSFDMSNLEVEAARANILAGQAAMDLGQEPQAEERLALAMSFVEGASLADLSYRAGLLKGRLLANQGRPAEALSELDRALTSLDQLGGRMMLEHRVSFLEDKSDGFVAAVRLAVTLGEPAKAFEFAERAKSQALLDLISNRVRIGIHARSAGDSELVDQLLELQSRRDHLYRKREADLRSGERGRQPFTSRDDLGSVAVLEFEITRLWHQLLLRNSDYSRDAALWQARAEPVQPYLDDKTVLIEFFAAGDEMAAFLVSNDEIDAHLFEFDHAHFIDQLNLLRVNLGTVAGAAGAEIPALRQNADGILAAIYQTLIGPIADAIPPAESLIIVPHGHLHYLPLHALRDDDSYLIERHNISYLPAAGVLGFCRRVRPKSPKSLAIGYSSGGALPHAVLEANTVASLLSGDSLLEGRATLEIAEPLFEEMAVLHFATHGEFRADNPLFSGLVLGDRELTVLDIFDLNLSASLVTLSACSTGQNVLGGGDELLGLMRAFLAAGAASILLTLWSVEDRSTARVMERFYSELVSGKTKAAALRTAQLALLRGELPHAALAHSHPYFWAPYVMIGDERSLEIAG